MTSLPTAEPSPGPLRRLGRASLGNLVGLVLEAALGVGLNLYVSIPSAPTVLQVFVSIPLLTAHIVLGFLLVASSAGLVVMGRRVSVPGLPVRLGLVLVFVVIALICGFSYVFTGNNAFSAGMALAFLLAVISDVLVLVHLRRADRSAAMAAPGTGIA